MGNVANKVRNHIGEGELTEAIDTLNNYLKNIGGSLYNQALIIKGSFKEYQRNRDLGLGDNREEKARIRVAVLNLATEIDKQKVDRPPSNDAFTQQKPNFQQVRQQCNTPPPVQQNQQRYVAQCFFNMDTMHYFVNGNNQIFMVNPFNNYTVQVGVKMPSQNPQFAWTLYFTTTNIYYLIDHAGIIWGQNFGMPAQYGTVKYF